MKLCCTVSPMTMKLNQGRPSSLLNWSSELPMLATVTSTSTRS